MPIGNAYKRKKGRENARKYQEKKNNEDKMEKASKKNPPRTYNKGKAKKTIETTENTVLPKFEWPMNTCSLSNNISFSDYLLELLTEENGRLLLMYKRIKVDNKLLDVTGSGALREIIRRIRKLGGEGITENTVRSKLRRIEERFRAVSKYEHETGRGNDEYGFTVQGNI
jgi:hypothetical protein